MEERSLRSGGGSQNPDGSFKRPARFVGPQAKLARKRERERERAARRGEVRKRFTEHKDWLERLGQ